MARSSAGPAITSDIQKGQTKAQDGTLRDYHKGKFEKKGNHITVRITFNIPDVVPEQDEMIAELEEIMSSFLWPDGPSEDAAEGIKANRPRKKRDTTTGELPLPNSPTKAVAKGK